MAWTVKLANYEGPLDLLLELLAGQQLDIAEVAVAQVTAQYLSYLESLPEEDLDLYTEFLVMGARLLALKARLLLPADKEPEKEEACAAEEAEPDLVACLARYKRFREAARALEELAESRSRYWDRGPDAEAYRLAASCSDPLAGVSLEDLRRVFLEVALRRAGAAQPQLPRREISLAEFCGRLREYLARGGGFALQEMFTELGRLVRGLLAVLILAHRGEVRLEQPEPWGPIYVFPKNLSGGEAVGG